MKPHLIAVPAQRGAQSFASEGRHPPIGLASEDATRGVAGRNDDRAELGWEDCRNCARGRKRHGISGQRPLDAIYGVWDLGWWTPRSAARRAVVILTLNAVRLDGVRSSCVEATQIAVARAAGCCEGTSAAACGETPHNAQPSFTMAAPGTQRSAVALIVAGHARIRSRPANRSSSQRAREGAGAARRTRSTHCERTLGKGIEGEGERGGRRARLSGQPGSTTR